MKKVIFGLLVVALAFVACKKDDGGGNTDDGCQTCASYELEVNGQTTTVPEVEVCELENGNAEIMGQDTGVEFSEYIAGLEFFTSCN